MHVFEAKNFVGLFYTFLVAGYAEIDFHLHNIYFMSHLVKY